jgi:hypothetical protein
MNHSIVTADRSTQLKIVVVALVGAIMVVSVGIAARLNATGLNLGTDIVATRDTSQAVKLGVVKPNQTVTFTSREDLKVR